MSETEIPPIQAVPPVVEAPPAPAPQHAPLVPLAGIPFPPLVKALAALTTVAFLLGLFRTPAAISNAVRHERGRKAIEAGKYDTAINQLSPLVEAFPAAEEARMDLVRAQIRGNRPKEALENLMWFEGKSVSKEEGEELNQLEQELGDKLPKDGESQGASQL